jgi:hypothetical protein
MVWRRLRFVVATTITHEDCVEVLPSSLETEVVIYTAIA